MLIFNSPGKITAQTKEFPELLLQTGKLSCSIIQPRKDHKSRNLFPGDLSKVQPIKKAESHMKNYNKGITGIDEKANSETEQKKLSHDPFALLLADVGGTGTEYPKVMPGGHLLNVGKGVGIAT